MSFHFHPKKYVPGLYDLLHALTCQMYYKYEKPKKFAGGKWSPKALQIYNSLGYDWKKAFDDAWIIYEKIESSLKPNQSSRYAEVEDSIRENLGLPTWLEENIAHNNRKDKHVWEVDYTLEELEEENKQRYAIRTEFDLEDGDES